MGARRSPPSLKSYGGQPSAKVGEVAEWSKAHDSKSCIPETGSRVRIPPSPPSFAQRRMSAVALAKVDNKEKIWLRFGWPSAILSIQRTSFLSYSSSKDDTLAKAVRCSRSFGRKETYDFLMYFVYLLQLSNSTIYIGATPSISRRLKEHAEGKCLSTKNFLPFTVSHYFYFQNRLQALRFERYLKSGSGRAFRKKHFG